MYVLLDHPDRTRISAWPTRLRDGESLFLLVLTAVSYSTVIYTTTWKHSSTIVTVIRNVGARDWIDQWRSSIRCWSSVVDAEERNSNTPVATHRLPAVSKVIENLLISNNGRERIDTGTHQGGDRGVQRGLRYVRHGWRWSVKYINVLVF